MPHWPAALLRKFDYHLLLRSNGTKVNVGTKKKNIQITSRSCKTFYSRLEGRWQQADENRLLGEEVKRHQSWKLLQSLTQFQYSFWGEPCDDLHIYDAATRSTRFPLISLLQLHSPSSSNLLHEGRNFDFLKHSRHSLTQVLIAQSEIH